MVRNEALAQGESRQLTVTPAPKLGAQRFYSTGAPRGGACLAGCQP